jgi:hypothetical protein
MTQKHEYNGEGCDMTIEKQLMQRNFIKAGLYDITELQKRIDVLEKALKEIVVIGKYAYFGDSAKMADIATKALEGDQL